MEFFKWKMWLSEAVSRSNITSRRNLSFKKMFYCYILYRSKTRKIESIKENCEVILSCLQEIENLDALASLQSLFLGTNKITQLQHLEGLHNLTVLSIQVFTLKSSSTLVGVIIEIV